MILDKIKYVSNEGLQQDPQYPEVYRIKLLDLAELHKCSCGGNLTPKDKEPKSRTIHDYDMVNKRVIIMTIFRKNYRCTKCKRSYTADSELSQISYTKEFERYIALEVIKGSELGFTINNKTGKSQWNFEFFAKRYGYCGNSISKIAKRYAPALTPLLVPMFGYNTFCLIPFMYQSKKKYYLIASKNGTQSMLLAVFGYNDAFEEVKTYFNLHKGFFLTQNSDSTIYTDFDVELIQFLKGFFVDVKILDALFKKKLEQYEEDLKRKNINKATQQASRFPFNYLNDSVIPNKYTNNKKDIEKWWSEVLEYDLIYGTEFAEYLTTLHKEVNDCKKELSNVIVNSDDFIKEIFENKHLIDKQIDKYASTRTDFNVLAARLMFNSQDNILAHYAGVYIYNSSIFIDMDKWQYYSEKEWNPEDLYEGHSFAQLILDTFNYSDTSCMILDYFWEHAKDKPTKEDLLEYEMSQEAFELFNDFINYDDETE